MNRLIILLALFYLSVQTSCKKEEASNKFYTPTAFTPNSDSINDIFKPLVDASIVQEYEMKIFDKYSNCLFTTDELSYGWDGRNSNGKACPEDIYICKFYFKFKDMTEEHYNASFRLYKSDYFDYY
jgi:gliding motility-associated-like protein